MKTVHSGVVGGLSMHFNKCIWYLIATVRYKQPAKHVCLNNEHAWKVRPHHGSINASCKIKSLTVGPLARQQSRSDNADTETLLS